MIDPWRGYRVHVGHADARFVFSIPAGLAPLRGVTPPKDRSEQLELASQGADGVGLVAPGQIALNSIVVFSDPEGVGRDVSAMSRAGQQQIANLYGEGVRGRYPGASAPAIVTVGKHLALRFELPRVAMANRPLRHGRHYLLFDELATASVDCLWTDAEAARMANACDAVARELQRLPFH